jgi:hypothetical protein
MWSKFSGEGANRRPRRFSSGKAGYGHSQTVGIQLKWASSLLNEAANHSEAREQGREPVRGLFGDGRAHAGTHAFRWRNGARFRRNSPCREQQRFRCDPRLKQAGSCKQDVGVPLRFWTGQSNPRGEPHASLVQH